jgi:cobyrinic acid a,c-diamide synthase
MIPRLVIAGTNSGVGKTTVAVGLMAALRERGLSIQPFKVGPDYIDPTYHALAAGRPGRNLDSWLIPPEKIASLFAAASPGAAIAVIEGVMGLFDGLGYDDDTASTAQIARLLRAPVVVVLDASRSARSVAAVAVGFQTYDPDVRVAGFIVNRVGSDRHGQGVAAAVEKATGLPVLGCLPRLQQLHVPERHLGLVPAVEPGRWREFVEAAGKVAADYLDLARLEEIARQATCREAEREVELGPIARNGQGSNRPVIAVARDEAFHFTYPENLELLQSAGADVAFFSPLRDEALPAHTAGVILSGGFPEILASALAANLPMHEALRAAHERGCPIYAECGGLMHLTQAIVDLDGRRHHMVGLLPGVSEMTSQLTLGYRLAEAADSSWLFERGELVRGHEFHYSAWKDRPADLPPAYRSCSPSRPKEILPEGACLGSLWASYIHLHWCGKPVLAERFVAECRKTMAIPNGCWSGE